MAQIKQDLQQLLYYKNDLEVTIEQQTNALEQKNRKFSQVEEQLRGKDFQMEQTDSALRRS